MVFRLKKLKDILVELSMMTGVHFEDTFSSGLGSTGVFLVS